MAAGDVFFTAYAEEGGGAGDDAKVGEVVVVGVEGVGHSVAG